MTDNPTGPELFREAAQHRDSFLATQANTAALVMLADLYASAHGIRSREVEVWTETVPAPPLVECWSKDARRPECAERHTEDCTYADPIPEPPHKLLPVGTRVLVSQGMTKYPDGRVVYDKQPKVAKIVGYDMHRSKYRLNDEKYGGGYYDFVTWAFADNRVQVHPEQDSAITEPTGPRVYVQDHHGKQGHVVEFRQNEGKLRVRVQWYAPGAEPVWRTLDTLTIIASEDVDRCAFGQTADECGEGENRCEQCLAAEDAEAEAIEESMR